MSRGGASRVWWHTLSSGTQSAVSMVSYMAAVTRRGCPLWYTVTMRLVWCPAADDYVRLVGGYGGRDAILGRCLPPRRGLPQQGNRDGSVAGQPCP